MWLVEVLQLTAMRNARDETHLSAGQEQGIDLLAITPLNSTYNQDHPLQRYNHSRFAAAFIQGLSYQLQDIERALRIKI